MPKLKDETLKKRLEIYENNKMMINILNFIYQGNFIQAQARKIILECEVKQANGKLYTEKIFNSVLADMEKLNLIYRKNFYDTHNKAVSFRKPLYCLMFDCVNDDLSSSKNAYNNTTNEIFDVSLFKGFYFLEVYKKLHKKYNYSLSDVVNGIIKNTNTMFINNEVILINVYKEILKKVLEKGCKYEYEYINSKDNFDNFKNRINQIHKSRKGEKGGVKKDIIDLSTLKKRKIYMIVRKESTEKLKLNFVFFCSSENYSLDKLYKNLKDTILFSCNLYEDLYTQDKIEISVNVYCYSEQKARILKSSLFDERTLNNAKKTKLIYFNKLLSETKFRGKINGDFTDTKINDDYRGECLRFKSKSTEPKKPTRKQLEAELKKKDELLNKKNEANEILLLIEKVKQLEAELAELKK